MGLPSFQPTLLTILGLPWLAAAGGLPVIGAEKAAKLDRADSISFDPLAIVAILWNPRASASAARLYSQPHGDHFRWPHMMQVGAATVPVSVLVGHLTSNYKSIHPSVEMFLADVDKLKVKSNISHDMNLFTSLPVGRSEAVLTTALNFRPSEHPANDIMIVSLGNREEDGAKASSTPIGPARFAAKAVGHLTELIMITLIVCGLVFSILMLDSWAIALFGSYLLHWAVSSVIPNFRMIGPDRIGTVKDNRFVYAVYERPSGGWVVFKGTQTIMEKWARTSWVFRESTLHRTIHWVWLVTGSLTAVASTASMVNMDGRLQLGFLGLLAYGSAAEVWLTVLYQKMQPDNVSYLGPCSKFAAHQTFSKKGNDKKYKSIIQASLCPDDRYRLEGLKWTQFKLLPQRSPFTTMEDTIEKLNASARKNNGAPTAEQLNEALAFFDAECEAHKVAGEVTSEGIKNEIKKVWEKRVEDSPGSYSTTIDIGKAA